MRRIYRNGCLFCHAHSILFHLVYLPIDNLVFLARISSHPHSCYLSIFTIISVFSWIHSGCVAFWSMRTAIFLPWTTLSVVFFAHAVFRFSLLLSYSVFRNSIFSSLCTYPISKAIFILFWLHDLLFLPYLNLWRFFSCTQVDWSNYFITHHFVLLENDTI